MAKQKKKCGMAAAKLRAVVDAAQGKSIDDCPYRDSRWRKCWREAFMGVRQLSFAF